MILRRRRRCRDCSVRTFARAILHIHCEPNLPYFIDIITLCLVEASAVEPHLLLANNIIFLHAHPPALPFFGLIKFNALLFFFYTTTTTTEEKASFLIQFLAATDLHTAPHQHCNPPSSVDVTWQTPFLSRNSENALTLYASKPNLDAESEVIFRLGRVFCNFAPTSCVCFCFYPSRAQFPGSRFANLQTAWDVM